MILMYHKVDLLARSMWWVSANAFNRQMLELKKYKVVYLDEYDPSDSSQVVITFDGVYQNVLRFAAPILKKFGYPFELFICGNTVGADFFDEPNEPKAPFCSETQLQELVAIGGRLQWHTNSHIDLSKVTDVGTIRSELFVPESLKQLDALGFRWFAYPYGSFNDQVVSEVSRAFRGAVSCNQGDNRSLFQLNRETAVESSSFLKRRISCVIASYNYGDFLPEAVESVLTQSIVPDEILISDDHSTDSTKEISEEYAARLPDLIRVNRNQTNLGIVPHFNKALQIVSGDYVCILGADNRMSSNYIEECAQILDADPNVAVVYTDFSLFGPRARLIYRDFPEEWQGPISEGMHRIVFPSSIENQAERLEQRNFIHGSSMFRKSAFLEVGGYLKKDERPEDYDLFKRMVAAGYTAKKADRAFLEYRQHSSEQANIRHMSALTLLHYAEKSRRLEAELRKVERSLWRKVFYPLIALGRLSSRVYASTKANGLTSTAKKIVGRINGMRR